ncbi:MAG: hypothetical protein ACREMJ_05460 [Gemmatimonadales bacterium]
MTIPRPTCLGIACLLAALPAVAQSAPDSARLVGVVRSAVDGAPLSGVMVALPGIRLFQVTDTSGRFDLHGISPGRHAVRVAYRDLIARDVELDFGPAEVLRLTFLLEVGAVTLEPVVVLGDAADTRLDLAGFYQRRRFGFGRYFTRQDIERRHPLALSHLLDGTGVFMRCVRGRCRAVQRSVRGVCEVPIFLDGLPVSDYDLDWVVPQDVAALELYRRSSETPRQYAQWGGACGALLVWTRVR